MNYIIHIDGKEIKIYHCKLIKLISVFINKKTIFSKKNCKNILILNESDMRYIITIWNSIYFIIDKKLHQIDLSSHNLNIFTPKKYLAQKNIPKNPFMIDIKINSIPIHDGNLHHVLQTNSKITIKYLSCIDNQGQQYNFLHNNLEWGDFDQLF